MELEIVFLGDLAERHQLPGLAGAMSIEGLARSLTLMCHYAVTGEVNKRYPFSDNFSLNLLTLEQGSFRAKFALNLSAMAVATWLGEAAIQGAVGNFATDLIKTTFNSAVGLAAQPDTQAFKKLQEQRPGDLDALRAATVPAMKHAHSVINRGASSIIVNGDNNRITLFNEHTKEFLDNVATQPLPEVKVVSVGMLNVNTRNGRVFDSELGKMVSIFVPINRSDRTLHNLAISLSKYAKNRVESQLYIKYYVREDQAGRPDRYTVVDAWFEGEPPPSE